MSDLAAELPEPEAPETAEGETPEAQQAPARQSNKEVIQETRFQVGDVVVVRSDFHSKYYRNLTGTITGEAIKGGTADPLWPVKIDVPPYKLKIAGKYLQLKAEAAQSAASRPVVRNGQPPVRAKGSFLTRFIPWKR